MSDQYTREQLFEMYPPIDVDRLSTALAACMLILVFASVIL